MSIPILFVYWLYEFQNLIKIKLFSYRKYLLTLNVHFSEHRKLEWCRKDGKCTVHVRKTSFVRLSPKLSSFALNDYRIAERFLIRNSFSLQSSTEVPKRYRSPGNGQFFQSSNCSLGIHRGTFDIVKELFGMEPYATFDGISIGIFDNRRYSMTNHGSGKFAQ